MLWTGEEAFIAWIDAPGSDTEAEWRWMNAYERRRWEKFADRLNSDQEIKEALEFYADPNTWDTISPRGTVTTNTIAKHDNGARARAALGRNGE